MVTMHTWSRHGRWGRRKHEAQAWHQAWRTAKVVDVVVLDSWYPLEYIVYPTRTISCNLGQVTILQETLGSFTSHMK